MEKTNQTPAEIIARLKSELPMEVRTYVDQFSATVTLKAEQSQKPGADGGGCRVAENACRTQDCLGTYTNCPGHESHCTVENCTQQTCKDHECDTVVCSQKSCQDQECGTVNCRVVAAAYGNLNLGNPEVQQLMRTELFAGGKEV